MNFLVGRYLPVLSDALVRVVALVVVALLLAPVVLVVLAGVFSSRNERYAGRLLAMLRPLLETILRGHADSADERRSLQ